MTRTYGDNAFEYKNSKPMGSNIMEPPYGREISLGYVGVPFPVIGVVVSDSR